MKRFALIAFSMFTPHLFPFNRADASSVCDAFPLPPKDSIARADVVFAGKVLGSRPTEIPAESNHAFMRVTFAVSRSIKGKVSSRIDVLTSPNLDCLGIPFEPNSEWLVYASGDRQLATSTSDGTKRIGEATEDFEYFATRAAAGDQDGR